MYNPRRLRAIALKETLQLIRDPRSVMLALLIPVLLLLLFGYALTLDVSDVPTVVWDQSRTPESRELLSLLDGSDYFNVTEYTTSYDVLEQRLDAGQALLALIIPADFARKLSQGQDTRLQILLDGSDSNTAQIAQGYAQGISLLFTQQRVSEQVAREYGASFQPPIELRQRALYNPELRSQNFIVPGLLVFIMAVIAALLTSLSVAREWELGTMEQLISTPVRGMELITGKLVPYWVVGMLDVIIIMLLGHFVFNVPLRGQPLYVLVAAGVFLVGVLSQGMLLSIATKSQVLASQMAILSTFLPTMILSGFVFSISNMPAALQLVSYIVPARYAIEITRAVYLKGIGPGVLLAPSLLLLGYAALFFILANRRFRKQLI